mgnify:CR=1 FL=1
MKKSSLDIETAALPLEQIQHLKPAFAAPSNYKDPVKIADNIAEQERKWLENAALSPLTGRVLVIGVKPFGEAPQVLEGEERDILAEFWRMMGYAGQYDQWYGHNIHGFDIPFLVRRSWLHGVPVPMQTLFGDRGYVNARRLIDTMVAFQCGNRADGFVSLDTVARFFGLPGKTEDIGAQFGEVYATDRERALSYHIRDLEIVEGVANRMFLPLAQTEAAA